jgi:hypothetical protein
MRSAIEIMIMELTYQFTNKEITQCGGMVFLKQFLDRMGFSDKVAACDILPQPGSNRGYPLTVLLASFGVVRRSLFIPNLLVQTEHYGRFSAGNAFPRKMLTSVFSANLPKRTICVQRLIFSAG